jgi:hypothetical protein
MRTALLAVAVLAAVLGAALGVQLAAAESRQAPEATPAPAPVTTPPPPPPAERTIERGPVVPGPSDRQVLRRIARYRNATWHWQELVGTERTPASGTERETESREYRLWVLRLWKQRAANARIRAQSPPHEQQWLCIHRYEGAWDDPGSPYYGGLQMDIGFQQTYGGHLLQTKGTADHWTPLEQMWVAERAHVTRGFTPWPNTARYCGLL